MQIKTMITSGAFCVTLALSGAAVFAQSASTMEGSAVTDEQAAEAKAKAAEAQAEAAVEKQKKEAAEGAMLNSEEVSGDMNPVDEGDAAQMEKMDKSK
jgi:hypothetical protein